MGSTLGTKPKASKLCAHVGSDPTMDPSLKGWEELLPAPGMPWSKVCELQLPVRIPWQVNTPQVSHLAIGPLLSGSRAYLPAH